MSKTASVIVYCFPTNTMLWMVIPYADYRESPVNVVSPRHLFRQMLVLCCHVFIYYLRLHIVKRTNPKVKDIIQPKHPNRWSIAWENSNNKNPQPIMLQIRLINGKSSIIILLMFYSSFMIISLMGARCLPYFSGKGHSFNLIPPL